MGMALTDSDKEFIELKINNMQEHLKNAIAAVVTEHSRTCSVKTEFYGNGKPGIKTDVHDLKRDVKHLKDCKIGLVAFMRDKLVAPVVTAIVVAALMTWLFGR